MNFRQMMELTDISSLLILARRINNNMSFVFVALISGGGMFCP